MRVKKCLQIVFGYKYCLWVFIPLIACARYCCQINFGLILCDFDVVSFLHVIALSLCLVFSSLVQITTRCLHLCVMLGFSILSLCVVCYAAFILDCPILSFLVSGALRNVCKLLFVTCTFCGFSFFSLPLQGIVL